MIVIFIIFVCIFVFETLNSPINFKTFIIFQRFHTIGLAKTDAEAADDSSRGTTARLDEETAAQLLNNCAEVRELRSNLIS